MTYVSKKDENVTATIGLEREDGKLEMVYLSGENAGKSFTVSESTLKRWWKKVETSPEPEKSEDVMDILNIDEEKVNEPYPEPVEQKYIPKPKAVIEYEERKGKRYNTELPQYDDIPEILDNHGIAIKRFNAGYISLLDNSKIKRLTSCIGFLCSEKYWEKLVEKGFMSIPCIEKGTPFRVDIKTKEEFEKFIEVLESVENEGEDE